MEFFQKGLTPPLAQTFGTFGALFHRLIFFRNFWGTFCVIFHQQFGKKCLKTFWIGSTSPRISNKNSKIVGVQKKCPKLLDRPGTQIKAACWFVRRPLVTDETNEGIMIKIILDGTRDSGSNIVPAESKELYFTVHTEYGNIML